MGIVRRNPGRMDGVRWNGRSFICARKVDGEGALAAGPHEEADERADTPCEAAWERRGGGALLASLLDIAKPAKTKGRPSFLLFVDRGTLLIRALG